MNKRIQEIVRQSITDTSGKWLSVDNAEKLAELIVRECCQYLTNEAERLYGLRHDDGDLLAEKCYDNIQGLKQHFGVN